MVVNWISTGFPWCPIKMCHFEVFAGLIRGSVYTVLQSLNERRMWTSCSKDGKDGMFSLRLILLQWMWLRSGWLTHWGQVTHICIGKLTIIGSDNGLLPCWHQAIIWTNAGILLIGPLGTNFSEILIGIQTFSLKKMHLKMSSGKLWPFCLSVSVLTIFVLSCL